MGFILLLGIIGIIAWAMSWQPRDARATVEPTAAAQPQNEDVDPDEGSAHWTALDEHQLNRLLNETT